MTATTRSRRRSAEKSTATKSGKNRAGSKNLSDSKGNVRVESIGPNRKKSGKETSEGRIASPETSRATTDALSFREQDHSLDEVEVEIPPATAPPPTEDNASGSTEFFSANTGKIIQTRSPLSNPFWLRRPESERRGVIHFSQNGNAEASPTHSRSDRSKRAVAESHQKRLSRTSARAQSASKTTPLSGNWGSSASASMLISSLINDPGGPPSGEAPGQHHESTDAQSKAGEPAPSIIGDHNPQPVASPRRVPQSTEADRLSQQSGNHKTLRTNGSANRATVDVPSSTRIHNAPLPPSSTLTRRAAREKVAEGAPRHDRVASPTLASSTGFKYRKISNPRSRTELPEPKARAVNIHSSPAKMRTDQEKHAEGSYIEVDAMPTVSKEQQDNRDGAQRHSELSNLADDMIKGLHQAEGDSEQPSHESAMSTQAAMLLAALEFQESTYRSLSPADTRRWSQVSGNISRTTLHVPSPAITPLSVFGKRLGEGFSKDSVLRGPPISTQDLFGAASPFAFSTMKKKLAGPRQSDLGFGLAQAHDDDLTADEVAEKSPTPTAERVPLKAKGNTPSLWSFISDKQLQASQESLLHRSRRSVNDVELPQFDLKTPLDEFEANSGLHFTDRFLHNLDTT